MDFSGNYFNSFYLSPYYLNGIEKISQTIAAENEEWNGFKSIAVICKILKNFILTNRGFFLKNRFISALDKAIDLLEHHTVKAESINRIRSPSGKGFDDRESILEGEIRRAYKLLSQFLDKDLRDNVEMADKSRAFISTNSHSLWYRFKQESEFIYFDKVWFNVLKSFVGI